MELILAMIMLYVFDRAIKADRNVSRIRRQEAEVKELMKFLRKDEAI